MGGKMKKRRKIRRCFIQSSVFIISAILIIICLHGKVFSAQWINPRELIEDPMIVRLQYKKELTDVEKEEIKKYGYTALEIMTYVDWNAEQGQDSDAFYRVTSLNKRGHISMAEWVERAKYYYKNRRALLLHEGIKPGDVEFKKVGVTIYPPNQRFMAWYDIFFVTSPEKSMKKDVYVWYPNIRKIRHENSGSKDDRWFFGSVFTMDDHEFREPWEEEHRILGEDLLRGHKCFVIESKNKDPNYYLSKRVVWVEENNFLDIHEEQFDREGRIFRIFDKYWKQVKPWNYWVKALWNQIDLSTGDRSIYQTFDWIFDKGYKDADFSTISIEKEKIWRRPKNPPPRIKKASQFPPPPRIRKEFWEKIGQKP